MIDQTTKNLTSKQAHVCSRHKPTRKGFCGKNHSRRHAPLLHKKGCICVFCSLIVALLAAGCGNSGSSNNAADSSATDSTAVTSSTAEIEALPQIVTTTDIWADVAEKATCGQAEVSSIIPSGSDPHHYSPSARDIIALENATLVVENGFGLEESLLDALSSVPYKLAVADLFEAEDSGHEGEMDHHDDEDHHDEDDHEDHEDHEDELENHDDEEEDHNDHNDHEDELENHDHDDEDHHDDHEDELEDHEDHSDHDHGGEDPHVWFDFNFARSLVSTLETRLAPSVADAEELAACAEDYIAQLHETEDIVAATLASVPESRRLLVTQHSTLQRLADRHGYEIIGSIIPSTSTLAEADVRHLIELGDQIRDTGATAIFADASGVNSDIETFADRIDLPLVVLYTESLGSPDTGADTYIGLMLTNANRIADALAAP